VSKRIGVSTATVYALCRRGDLGHYRISNAIRIPESALAKYLAAAAVATPRATDITERR
jgi:excisionase family DNA binding protein